MGWGTGLQGLSPADAAKTAVSAAKFMYNKSAARGEEEDDEVSTLGRALPFEAGAHQSISGSPRMLSPRGASRSPRRTRLVETSVEVWVRTRPVIAAEEEWLTHQRRGERAQRGDGLAVRMYPPAHGGCVTICSRFAKASLRTYCVDRCFWSSGTRCQYGAEHVGQEGVAEALAPTVDLVMAGVNATVMCYGQASSGKTHTMFGPGGAAGSLVSRLLSSVQHFNSSSPHRKMMVEVGVVEIYLNDVYDLLMPHSRRGRVGGKPSNLIQVQVTAHRPPQGGAEERHVSMPDLTWKRVYTPADFQAVLTTALRKSSQHRSHVVALARVTKVFGRAPFAVGPRELAVSGAKDPVRTASCTLTLVDLAGHTDLRKGGRAIQETVFVNKSLSILRMVVERMDDRHVPFRDSALTKVLINSLGGNCKTVIIANISPHEACYQETKNVLAFAEAAKRVSSLVTFAVPEVSGEDRIHELRRALEDDIWISREQRAVLEALVADELDELSGYNGTIALLAGRESQLVAARNVQQAVVDKLNSIVSDVRHRVEGVDRELEEAQGAMRGIMDCLAKLEAQQGRQTASSGDLEAERALLREKLNLASHQKLMLQRLRNKLLERLDGLTFETMEEGWEEGDGLVEPEDMGIHGDTAGAHCGEEVDSEAACDENTEPAVDEGEAGEEEFHDTDDQKNVPLPPPSLPPSPGCSLPSPPHPPTPPPRPVTPPLKGQHVCMDALETLSARIVSGEGKQDLALSVREMAGAFPNIAGVLRAVEGFLLTPSQPAPQPSPHPETLYGRADAFIEEDSDVAMHRVAELVEQLGVMQKDAAGYLREIAELTHAKEALQTSVSAALECEGLPSAARVALGGEGDDTSGSPAADEAIECILSPRNLLPPEAPPMVSVGVNTDPDTVLLSSTPLSPSSVAASMAAAQVASLAMNVRSGKAGTLQIYEVVGRLRGCDLHEAADLVEEAAVRLRDGSRTDATASLYAAAAAASSVAAGVGQVAEVKTVERRPSPLDGLLRRIRDIHRRLAVSPGESVEDDLRSARDEACRLSGMGPGAAEVAVYEAVKAVKGCTGGDTAGKREAHFLLTSLASRYPQMSGTMNNVAMQLSTGCTAEAIAELHRVAEVYEAARLAAIEIGEAHRRLNLTGSSDAPRRCLAVVNKLVAMDGEKGVTRGAFSKVCTLITETVRLVECGDSVSAGAALLQASHEAEAAAGCGAAAAGAAATRIAAGCVELRGRLASSGNFAPPGGVKAVVASLAKEALAAASVVPNQEAVMAKRLSEVGEMLAHEGTSALGKAGGAALRAAQTAGCIATAAKAMQRALLVHDDSEFDNLVKQATEAARQVDDPAVGGIVMKMASLSRSEAASVAADLCAIAGRDQGDDQAAARLIAERLVELGKAISALPEEDRPTALLETIATSSPTAPTPRTPQGPLPHDSPQPPEPPEALPSLSHEVAHIANLLAALPGSSPSPHQLRDLAAKAFSAAGKAPREAKEALLMLATRLQHAASQGASSAEVAELHSITTKIITESDLPQQLVAFSLAVEAGTAHPDDAHALCEAYPTLQGLLLAALSAQQRSEGGDERLSEEMAEEETVESREHGTEETEEGEGNSGALQAVLALSKALEDNDDVAAHLEELQSCDARLAGLVRVLQGAAPATPSNVEHGKEQEQRDRDAALLASTAAVLVERLRSGSTAAIDEAKEMVMRLRRESSKAIELADEVDRLLTAGEIDRAASALESAAASRWGGGQPPTRLAFLITSLRGWKRKVERDGMVPNVAELTDLLDKACELGRIGTSPIEVGAPASALPALRSLRLAKSRVNTVKWGREWYSPLKLQQAIDGAISALQSAISRAAAASVDTGDYEALRKQISHGDLSGLSGHPTTHAALRGVIERRNPDELNAALRSVPRNSLAAQVLRAVAKGEAGDEAVSALENIQGADHTMEECTKHFLDGNDVQEIIPTLERVEGLLSSCGDAYPSVAALAGRVAALKSANGMPSLLLAAEAESITRALKVLSGEPEDDEVAAAIISQHLEALLKGVHQRTPSDIASALDAALCDALLVAGIAPSPGELAAAEIAEKLWDGEEGVAVAKSMATSYSTSSSKHSIMRPAMDEVLTLVTQGLTEQASQAAEHTALAIEAVRKVANTLRLLVERNVPPTASELSLLGGRALAASSFAPGGAAQVVVSLAEQLGNAAARAGRGEVANVKALYSAAARAAGVLGDDEQGKGPAALVGMVMKALQQPHPPTPDELTAVASLAANTMLSPDAPPEVVAAVNSLRSNPSAQEAYASLAVIAAAASAAGAGDSLQALEALSSRLEGLQGEQSCSPSVALSRVAVEARSLAIDHPSVRGLLLTLAANLEEQLPRELVVAVESALGPTPPAMLASALDDITSKTSALIAACSAATAFDIPSEPMMALRHALSLADCDAPHLRPAIEASVRDALSAELPSNVSAILLSSLTALTSARMALQREVATVINSRSTPDMVRRALVDSMAAEKLMHAVRAVRQDVPPEVRAGLDDLVKASGGQGAELWCRLQRFVPCLAREPREVLSRAMEEVRGPDEEWLKIIEEELQRLLEAKADLERKAGEQEAAAQAVAQSLNEAQRKVTATEAEVERLKGQLKDSESRCTSLEESLERMRQELDTVRTSFTEQAEAMRGSHAAEVAQLQGEIAEARAARDTAAREVETMKVTCTEQAALLERQHSDLDQATRRVEELTRETEEIRLAHTRREGELEQLLAREKEEHAEHTQSLARQHQEQVERLQVEHHERLQREVDENREQQQQLEAERERVHREEQQGKTNRIKELEEACGLLEGQLQKEEERARDLIAQCEQQQRQIEAAIARQDDNVAAAASAYEEKVATLRGKCTESLRGAIETMASALDAPRHQPALVEGITKAQVALAASLLSAHPATDPATKEEVNALHNRLANLAEDDDPHALLQQARALLPGIEGLEDFRTHSKQLTITEAALLAKVGKLDVEQLRGLSLALRDEGKVQAALMAEEAAHHLAAERSDAAASALEAAASLTLQYHGVPVGPRLASLIADLAVLRQRLAKGEVVPKADILQLRSRALEAAGLGCGAVEASLRHLCLPAVSPERIAEAAARLPAVSNLLTTSDNMLLQRIADIMEATRLVGLSLTEVARRVGLGESADEALERVRGALRGVRESIPAEGGQALQDIADCLGWADRRLGAGKEVLREVAAKVEAIAGCGVPQALQTAQHFATVCNSLATTRRYTATGIADFAGEIAGAATASPGRSIISSALETAALSIKMAQDDAIPSVLIRVSTLLKEAIAAQENVIRVVQAGVRAADLLDGSGGAAGGGGVDENNAKAAATHLLQAADMAAVAQGLDKDLDTISNELRALARRAEEAATLSSAMPSSSEVYAVLAPLFPKAGEPGGDETAARIIAESLNSLLNVIPSQRVSLNLSALSPVPSPIHAAAAATTIPSSAEATALRLVQILGAAEKDVEVGKAVQPHLDQVAKELTGLGSSGDLAEALQALRAIPTDDPQATSAALHEGKELCQGAAAAAAAARRVAETLWSLESCAAVGTAPQTVVLASLADQARSGAERLAPRPCHLSEVADRLDAMAEEGWVPPSVLGHLREMAATTAGLPLPKVTAAAEETAVVLAGMVARSQRGETLSPDELRKLASQADDNSVRHQNDTLHRVAELLRTAAAKTEKGETPDIGEAHLECAKLARSTAAEEKGVQWPEDEEFMAEEESVRRMRDILGQQMQEEMAKQTAKWKRRLEESEKARAQLEEELAQLAEVLAETELDRDDAIKLFDQQSAEIQELQRAAVDGVEGILADNKKDIRMHEEALSVAARIKQEDDEAIGRLEIEVMEEGHLRHTLWIQIQRLTELCEYAEGRLLENTSFWEAEEKTLQQQLVDAEVASKELEDAVFKREEEAQRLREEIEKITRTITEDLKRRDADIAALHKKLEEKEDIVLQLEAEVEVATKATAVDVVREAVEERLREEVEKLKEEVEAAATKFAAERKRADEMQAKYEACSNELRRLKEQLARVKQQSAEEVADRAEELQSAKDDIADLKQEIQLLQQQHADECAALEKELETIAQGYEKLEKEKERIEAELAEANELIIELSEGT